MVAYQVAITTGILLAPFPHSLSISHFRASLMITSKKMLLNYIPLLELPRNQLPRESVISCDKGHNNVISPFFPKEEISNFQL